MKLLKEQDIEQYERIINEHRVLNLCRSFEDQFDAIFKRGLEEMKSQNAARTGSSSVPVKGHK